MAGNDAARAGRDNAPGPGTGPQASAADLVDALRGQVAELDTQVAELEDRWRRALADFDNLRKRVERESAVQRARERAHVAAQWLPVLDNLDLALEHATDQPSPLADGVRAVRDQALDVLARLGFPRRSDEGAAFDPTRHEVVAVRPAAQAPAGTVLQVVRPGYGTDERPLRPASVVVAEGG